MSFLEQWIKQNAGKHPSRLGRNTIKADRWDFRHFDQMLNELREFNAERAALCEIAEESGNGLWADAFFSFLQVEPKFENPNKIQPRYAINRAIMEQALELPEHSRLKQWTEGDDVAAADACISIRPELEQLYDRTKTAIQRAEALQKKMEELAAKQQEQRDLDQLIQEWQEQDPENPEDSGEMPADYQQAQNLIQAQIEQLEQQIQAEGQGIDEDMEDEIGVIKGILKVGLSRAAEEAEQAGAMANMWGMAPGTLQRLPAEERMKLAKRLNNERFRRMADLFGPLQRMMHSEQQRRVNYVPEEIYDIGMGKDLEHTLLTELSKISHPLRRYEFYKDYLEGRLMEYKLRGEENVGRGDIICCIDNSGSMRGDKELWAKAIALCLLHLSRQQKRGFRGIHFGSTTELKEFDFTNEYSVDQVLDFAEFFYGGGTAFVPPMSLALDHLTKQFNSTGHTRADIVFITDGICGVPNSWKQEFITEMQRIDATMWGLVIGNHPQVQPLKDLCQGKVATVADILNAHGEAKAVFSGI